MRRTILTAAVILCAMGLNAQTQSTQLDEVVVVGKRPVKQTAAIVTKIDSMQMKEASSESFAELLSKHSTIFVKTYGQGSVATVSFRGTAASHTQVEWNGVNINNPMLGQVDFSLIPVWFVDQTEIYSGGSSMQQGSGALGGEVSMSSSVEWGRKLYASFMQNVGSYGTYQTFVDVGGGNRKWQVRFRYMYDMAENDFEYLNRAIPPFEEVKQTNADYKKHGGVLDLNYNAGKDNFLSLNVWFLHADRNLPTIMSYQGAGRKETQTDNDFRAVFRWNKFWKKLRSEFSTAFATTNIDYFMSNVTGNTTFVNNDSRSVVYSFYNKYKIEYTPSERTVYRFMMNANYHAVNIFDRRTEDGYSADRVEMGWSVSAHHRFSDWFSGFALLREDVCEGRWTSPMPSAGVELTPLNDKKFVIKTNVARNYHQPTLNDMYWSPGGNPDLRPEEGYTGDVSVGYERKMGKFNFNGTVTGFLSDINDWIMWRPSEYRYWTAENIKSVFSRGVEVDAYMGFTCGEWKAGVGGNYAYTRTTNEDENSAGCGRQLIYIPEHKGNIFMDASWKGFGLYYVWSAVSERYTTESEESTRHTLKGYDVHNITLSKNWNINKTWRVESSLKINNAFDRKYQAILWRAMPGRNYMFSLKFSYN